MEEETKISKLIGRYLAEVVVIFLGITISFLFDQWRQGREQSKKEIEFVQSLLTDIEIKKNEILNDAPDVIVWINRLDSINKSRLTKSVEPKQLSWFYWVLTASDIFFFDSNTPSFNVASNTALWQELPDSLRRKIYDLYNVDFVFDKMVYSQLRNTITDFRNGVIIPHSTIAFVNTDATAPDYKKFEEEIRKEEYGNVLSEIIIQERMLRRNGEQTIQNIDELKEMLNSFLKSRTE